MKTVLLICYVFPPAGGGGVQRPLKFVKYLGGHGWTPVVATPDRPSSPVWDQDLLRQLPADLAVERLPSLEPGAGGAANAPGPANSSGWRARLAAWLFPDRHVLWLPTALPGLLRALKRHQPQAVMVTAPPFSSFILGWLAARIGGLPLVLDFRDEWSGFYAKGYGPGSAGRLWAASVRVLERRLVAAASRVVCASPDYCWRFRELYGGPAGKFVWIPNGFDPADYPPPPEPPAPGPATPERPLRLVYAGSVHPVTSLDYLWRGLAVLSPEERRCLSVQVLGRVNPEMTADPGLKGLRVQAHGYCPHAQALAAMQTAHALLLTLSPGPGVERVIPGKLYEYLGAGRPILALTPPGRAAAMMEEARAGTRVDPDCPAQIAATLREWLETPPRGSSPPPPQYDRQRTAGLLASVLEEAVRQQPRRARADKNATQVFFRNDDVGEGLAGLAELGGLFRQRGLPLAHAVIPAKLTPEVTAWLRDQAPHGQIAMLHGWDHQWRVRGEFSGRPLAEQMESIRRGQLALKEAFGSQFLPAMTFPWHLYDDASLKALRQNGLPLMSGIYAPTRQRRAFFALGRALGRDTLAGRNVSWHGRQRPCGVWEISVSVDPVIRYAQPPASAPHHDLAGLIAQFQSFAAATPIVGVMLHHDFYTDPARLAVVADFLTWLSRQPRVRVRSLPQIWESLRQASPTPQERF